ncbi:protein translocase subunit secG [Faunimonas pinastri]|uniref:Protein-export membrane protein SecG n=1 Tax=Faunimonas pinastri TaxID=1855383 RepID=A0A1H9N8U0_9HYPH|nr:preprotein translocase subunit SecG [Faunimonas pinastri]SER32318.1 protein translocase subunit secG [Faunimonas pinastri]
MTTVLIVIHLMVILAMIGLVLLQRSEGGALGVGGGSGGFMSRRGAGNVLTRSTAILATVFFVTSIGLTLLARIENGSSDILSRIGIQQPAAPANRPAAGTPQLPTGTPSNASSVLDALKGQSQGASGGTGPQTPPSSTPATPQAQAPTVPAPADVNAASPPAPEVPAAGTDANVQTPASTPAPQPAQVPSTAGPEAPNPAPAPAPANPAPANPQ